LLTAHELDGVTAPLPAARTLPPVAYTSAEVFERECREIFHREWICVARTDQIPAPGDYLTVDLAGQPLIVVRLEDETIHAMSSVCMHRAMPVASGCGNAKTFQCPYHLWKYRLNGELISAPHMDGVESFQDDCTLPALRTEVWEGFVFVNLDPEAESLCARLTGLDPLVGGYRMRDMVVTSTLEFDSPWNWKILVENFMEAYHHIGPHRESVQPTHHANDSYVSGSVDEGWSVLHMPESESGSDGPAAALPAIEGLSERQQTEILASVIMPNCLWLNTASVAFWYQPMPVAHDNMKLLIHTLLPRELAEGPGADLITEAVQESIRNIHLEDISVNEGPWQGFNAPLTGQGPLSLLEESIWQLNQWWVRRICP
jgi:phenylpropionate dioxygenase-like ring-hydroxylating dioxygenase large terminal subunit